MIFIESINSTVIFIIKLKNLLLPNAYFPIIVPTITVMRSNNLHQKLITSKLAPQSGALGNMSLSSAGES